MPTVIARFSLIGRPAGTSAAAESVSANRPSSTSWMITADVSVLLTLAKAKAVSGVTGWFFATFARPETPVQLVPSGRRTVAETPGIASVLRALSRVAWKRAWSEAAFGTAEDDGPGRAGSADGPVCCPGTRLPLGP